MQEDDGAPVNSSHVHHTFPAPVWGGGVQWADGTRDKWVPQPFSCILMIAVLSSLSFFSRRSSPGVGSQRMALPCAERESSTPPPFPQSPDRFSVVGRLVSGGHPAVLVLVLGFRTTPSGRWAGSAESTAQNPCPLPLPHRTKYMPELASNCTKHHVNSHATSHLLFTFHRGGVMCSGGVWGNWHLSVPSYREVYFNLWWFLSLHLGNNLH